jgi:hypothetical protein
MARLRSVSGLGLVFVVAALGGAGALASGAFSAARVVGAVAAAVTPPAGGPVLAGFSPGSFTAIGDYTWWLLGTRSCSSPPCSSIVRTTDGGVHFVAIPAPPVADTGISFADRLDGFAFGDRLYDTHNGGASWHKVKVSGFVSSLAIGGGYVYADVVPEASSSWGRVLRSAVGRDHWVTLTAAGSVYAGGLSVHDTDVFVAGRCSPKPGICLLVSSNGGASFTNYGPPPSEYCGYQEPQPPVVWAHCGTGTASEVFRSTDAGRVFHPASIGVMLSNHAVFGAASATVAVAGDFRLYRTANGGVSYTPVGPTEHSWSYLGFTNTTHGAALVRTSQGRELLFYTTNAGLGWHEVAIVSGPFAGAPKSQSFGNGSSCPAAPANPYLTTPAGCLSVRLADVDGDGRPDLVLLYNHPGVKNLDYKFTLKVYRASGGTLTVQLPAGDIPASFLLLRNVNRRPGVEIFIHTVHISNGEIFVIYTFNGTKLQQAASFSYGGDVEVQYGVTCHVPTSIVQDEFSVTSPLFPASQRPWTHRATTYTWVGAALKQSATTTTTFKGANPPASELGLHC